jgi:hypothetical protein
MILGPPSSPVGQRSTAGGPGNDHEGAQPKPILLGWGCSLTFTLNAIPMGSRLHPVCGASSRKPACQITDRAKSSFCTLSVHFLDESLKRPCLPLLQLIDLLAP